MNNDGEYETGDRVYFEEHGPDDQGTVCGFDEDGDPIVEWDSGGPVEAFHYNDLQPVRSTR